MNRRDYLLGSSALALSACASEVKTEIIDTHTHFYDPSRPQGVPWPGKSSSLYRKVTPEEFVQVTRSFGITGTIVVEASSWIEDNQYLLDLAAKHKVIYGVVGHLSPGSQDFEKYLKRFAKNSYFKGIRVPGKVLDNLDKQEVRDDFRRLADLDLTVDINGLRKLEQIYKLARLFPSLKIVIEHISNPGTKPELLRKTAALPNVYGKVSAVLKKKDNQAQVDLQLYKVGLDSLWQMFGPDKLIYGSNWPVSDKYNGTYEQVFSIIDQYTSLLSSTEKKMFFGENSKKIYRC